MRKVRHLIAVLLALGAAGTALAQERQEDRSRREGDQPDRGSAAQRADKQIAYCLLVDNWTKVEVSKAAVPQLQQPDVRQFAEQMIADHSRAMEQLQQVTGDTSGRAGRKRERLDRGAAPNEQNRNDAGNPNRAEPGADSPSAQADDNAAANLQPAPADEGAAADAGAADRGDAVQRHAARGLPFLQVKQRIAEQCVQTAKRELDSKNPDEIDRCFMTFQVFGHTAMLDELTVLQDYASPELRQVIDQSLQTTRQHLEQAKQILETLEGEQGRPAAAAGLEAPTESGETSP